MASKDFAFRIISKDKFARSGLIETHRGDIKKFTTKSVIKSLKYKFNE